MSVKGYKVFNPDWTCKGKQYACPGTFEEDVNPSVCNVGMHFCKKPADCFNYYSFSSDNHVAEVIAYGVVSETGDKCATNKLEIVREIPWAEVLELVNTGNGNTGNRNTGNRNTGYCNTGDRNTGDRNTGDWNTGDRNTGDWNTGNWNTGYCNTGNWNTGYCNTGDCNTGDWNTTSFSNGCFNTVSPKIYMFDRFTDWTFEQWFDCRARCLLNQIEDCPLEYVYLSDMTDEEKAAHPEAKTTGGYLKERTLKANAQNWWDSLNDADRNTILSLPNFDADIFYKTTGIDINKT